MCVKNNASKFADSMITATIDPRLVVEGAGLISLPLSPEMARTLIGICNQAPFGKGESTLVDKEVRDTWELDASCASHQVKRSMNLTLACYKNELYCRPML